MKIDLGLAPQRFADHRHSDSCHARRLDHIVAIHLLVVGLIGISAAGNVKLR